MKKWKSTTRDGTPVRIYATCGDQIHGAIRSDGVWRMRYWDLDGSYSFSEKEYPHDLLPAEPERIVVEGFYIPPDSERFGDKECAFFRQLLGKRGRLEFVVEDET